MIRAALFLLAVMALAAPARGNETGDYRARTIYFIVTDRFNAHHPFSPYVDPQYPDATNIVNCFLGGCRQEAEFRKYWGGDLQGVRERLGYVRRLGISALWVTPLMENVRDYELGTGYGTGYPATGFKTTIGRMRTSPRPGTTSTILALRCTPPISDTSKTSRSTTPTHPNRTFSVPSTEPARPTFRSSKAT